MSGYNTIDQPDSSDPNMNLVGNANCECNYGLNGNDWKDWLDEFINHLQQKPTFQQDRWWLGGSGGLAPSWAMDATMCWVSNPRDLIMMQNTLFWHREDWNNQQVPLADWRSGESPEMRKYWGWNEIPVDRNIVEDTSNWDAVMIKLPADICNNHWGAQDTVWCLGDWEQQDLENQLDQFVQQGKLKPGAENVGYRPGSYVVFVREWGTLWGSSLESSRNHSREVGSSFSGVNWQRWFYCEDWISPNGKYKITPVAKDQDPNGNGACYIEYGGAPPSPPSPAPASYNPNAIVHIASGKCMDVQDGDVSNGKALIASHCEGQQSQGWWFDDNAMTLTHASNNGMCVDVPNGDLSAGNTLEIWDCKIS
jgi:hypothetical protein